MSGPAPATRDTAADPRPQEGTPQRESSNKEAYAADIASEYDRINLGCGDDIRDDHFNVDIRETDDMDMAWNLEDTPWPWPDNSFDRALVDNVLEHIHVRQRTAFITECHRILRPGGTLVLRLPVPEVGVGWDETHHPIPSWKVLEHPRWRDHWRVDDYHGKRVGAGRLLPERWARLASRQGLRCVDEVTVTARPRPVREIEDCNHRRKL